MRYQRSVGFFRYTIVGLIINATLYGIHFLLPWLLMNRAAITLLFGIGSLASHFPNRNVTFQHSGRYSSTLYRFPACYAGLYARNHLALQIFSIRVRALHQMVQACATGTVHVLAFVMQKYWVFAAEPEVASRARRIGEL